MKETIKNALIKAGADDVGICRARIYEEIPPDGAKSEEIYQKRINPFLIMPQAKSVIVFIISYKSDLSGNISSYAYGRDYHAVMRETAQAAVHNLEARGYSALSFSDTGDLCDRHLAYLAGLGFFGKNHMLIHPKYGSFIFIGYIITDCPLDADLPLDKTCFQCGKCINSCPTGTLKNGNFENCLSNITQKRGTLCESEENYIKNSPLIWGCDICQTVCPHNKNAPNASNSAFCENLITYLDIPDEMSNREFLRIYKDRAFSWRGKGVIKRNIEIKNKTQ